MLLLLTSIVKHFHILFLCFCCWFWSGKYWQGRYANINSIYVVTTIKRENLDSENSKSTLHYENQIIFPYKFFKRQQWMKPAQLNYLGRFFAEANRLNHSSFANCRDGFQWLRFCFIQNHSHWNLPRQSINDLIQWIRVRIWKFELVLIDHLIFYILAIPNL